MIKLKNGASYIEAIDDIYIPKPNEVSLFLGGGISGCMDWQKYVIEIIEELSPIHAPDVSLENFVILNPRRKNFPMDDPSAATAQIEWEHHHLKLANLVMFWFPHETLCPITLFEYGKHIVGDKKLFVGCHVEYKRKIDVEVQTRLEQPDLPVRDGLNAICEDILIYLNRKILGQIMLGKY